MQVNSASREQLAAVNRRFWGMRPYQFRHMTAAHPSAHITDRPGRVDSIHFVCGAWVGSKSVLAQDGAKVCTRCAGWLRARSTGGVEA